MKTAFIDWTEENLNLYVFEKEADKYYVAEISSVSIEGEPDLAVLNSLPLAESENIYLSIPINLLTLREENFPFSDKDKINDTISYELEGILLGNINDYSIDHIITEPLETGSKVLAVCLEKIRLQKLINMFSSAGLEPKVITSLDLRLSGSRSENLLENPISDTEVRAEAAGEEILNPLINLRQDKLAYTGDIKKFIKSLRLTATLALALLIVIGAGSTLRLINLNKERTLLTSELQGIYRQVFPEDKKIIDAQRQFKGNMKMLIKKKAALGGIPVLDILQNIAVNKNKNITLHEFNADGKNLVIKGTAKSFEDVESLKNSLTPVFKGVKVMDTGATADKKINFTIIMQETTV
jgi:type II secretory pathway component PulL